MAASSTTIPHCLELKIRKIRATLIRKRFDHKIPVVYKLPKPFIRYNKLKDYRKTPV